MRIGIVGCGNISNQYCKAGRQFPILDLAACADIDLDRAKAKAKEHNIPVACTVEELLADDSIELVLNLTIPAAHAAVALKAIAAGKHVYGEKPLAINTDEGQRVLEAAKAKGVRVGSAPDTFLGTGHQTARRVIDEGLIGRPVAASGLMLGHGAEGWHPNPEFFYKPGGGPMFDMGPYYIAAMINMLGPITRVTGMAGIQIPERVISSKPLFGQKIVVETPDHAAGQLQFANGTIATLTTSFVTWHGRYDASHPITIYGTEGTLAVPDPNCFDGDVLVRLAKDSDWHKVEVKHQHPNGRSLGLADMATAIRHDRPHRANSDVAFATLGAMQGFLDAARTGTHVTFAGDYQRPAMLPTGLSGDGVLDG